MDIAVRTPLLDLDDESLAQDLQFAGLIEHVSSRRPMPWRDFNQCARHFFRSRVSRRAAVRGVASLYRDLDAACRDAIGSCEEIGARLAEFADTTDWLTDDLTDEELRVIAGYATGELTSIDGEQCQRVQEQ